LSRRGNGETLAKTGSEDGQDRRERTMKCYAVVQETIHDEEMFGRYRAKVLATLEPFGGTFVVRGGRFTVLEGEAPYERLVVLEFPSRKAAEDWYASPAYQDVLPLRLKSSTSSFVLIDGP
jgi:uncharacterized protein (DUF1330 family)